MKLVTVYGSPTSPGKLARGLDLIENYVRKQYPSWKTHRLAAERMDRVSGVWSEQAVAEIESADAVIVASPVFRGSFPGNLKLLLDMLPNVALRSKPVGIFTIAAAPHHFLSAERHLRDVLAWFGALSAPNSLFTVDAALAEEPTPDDLIDEIESFASQVIQLRDTTRDLSLGPDPLHVKMTSRK